MRLLLWGALFLAWGTALTRPLSLRQPSVPIDAFTERLMPLASAVQTPAVGSAALLRAVQQLALLPAASAALGWLPRYYQAYACIRLALLAAPDAPRQTAYLDQAQHTLAQAAAPTPAGAAELLVLQAYLYQIRLTTAPFTQVLHYSSLTRSTLDRARQLAPDNPRLYFVLGNDDFHRPRLLGGGAAVARASYAKAEACFRAFRPATPAVPTWGAAQTQAAMARCQ
ncbi:hypothetical protein GCM10028822_13090 [Hymenobacter terrigena]